MSKSIKKTSSRFWVQAFMVMLVLGLFIAACGNDKNSPLYYNACSSGYIKCANTGKCCPETARYYCSDLTTETSGKTGCLQSTAGCDVQTVYCGG